MPLQQLSFGPFTGLADTANPSLGMQGKLRAATGIRYSGVGRLSARQGTRLALTFYDDAGTPAPVTTVCACVPFADGALAVAHSTATNKVYLYRLNFNGGSATLNAWTNAAGALQTTLLPQPVGVLWTALASPPDVSIAEGLGIGYIAHAGALDGVNLVAPTKQFTDSTRVIATLQSDLDLTSSLKDIYFRGVISFQQHLWGWSFGSGATAATGFRPEMIRFSHPIFDPTGGPGAGGLFSGGTDSFTVGNRVRSQREQIVGAGIAGEELYVGAPFMLTRFTGTGRNSWYKKLVDPEHGFAGPKCMATAGDTLYFWATGKGPMRTRKGSTPEPLWDKVFAAAMAAVNPQKVVAGYDPGTDIVSWTYDGGSGVRAWIGFDIARDEFCVVGDDWGQVIYAAASVSPVYQSSAAATIGPAGPPTTPSTTAIGTSTATANWVAGDSLATTRLEYRQQGTTPWTVVSASLSPGVTSCVITGLTPGASYEWHAAHVKDGITSAYLGPVALTQFTTSTGTLLPPSNLGVVGGPTTMSVSWTNSGESGVSTEIYLSGPNPNPPAPGSWVLPQTAAPGVSSATLTGITPSGTYWVQIRHVRQGSTPSTYVGPASDYVTTSSGGLI
jgi:hypothetical protein